MSCNYSCESAEGWNDTLLLNLKSDETSVRMQRLVDRSLNYLAVCPKCEEDSQYRVTNPSRITPPKYLLAVAMRY